MKIGIIMGSDSDLHVMKEAADFLKELNIPFELTIVSAHRTPQRLYEYAESARESGISVIIAGAGGAAHLPGMVASVTTLPVIGVPIKTKDFGGTDSLYSIVQMPPGIPVATVAINGGQNAGILAASILSVHDPEIRAYLRSYKDNLNTMVHDKIAKLEKIGYDKYLKEMENDK
ncbi:MAG: 5-(carboxyamino)imidazole ribonucleotide mutase [Oscillospiraceae bacterium]|nr:5-(carboxyamino)imidazole ribonucleotide mutase [Oscillospiraceae bacterium]